MFPKVKSPLLYVSTFFEGLGEVSLLCVKTFKNLFKKPWEKGIFIQQLEEIGVRSLPVVSLTAAFGGLVFGLQTYLGFHRYIGPGLLPMSRLRPAAASMPSRPG